VIHWTCLLKRFRLDTGPGFDEEGFKVPNAGQPQLQITRWAIPVLTGPKRPRNSTIFDNKE